MAGPELGRVIEPEHQVAAGREDDAGRDDRARRAGGEPAVVVRGDRHLGDVGRAAERARRGDEEEHVLDDEELHLRRRGRDGLRAGPPAPHGGARAPSPQRHLIYVHP